MLRHFRRDDAGVAAIEFALLFPVMLLLYFGTAEVTMAMISNGRASHVASVVGDLVTQMPSVTKTDMEDIFAVGNAIMKPLPTAPLKMRISSVTGDPKTGTPTIKWSKAQGFTPLNTGAASGFPAGLLAPSESIVMAEVEYTFTSPIQQTLPKPLTFTGKYYIKPRRSSEVAWVGP
jgi:Flp pilus assembly protein TadG